MTNWAIIKQLIQKIGHAEWCIVSFKVNSKTICGLTYSILFDTM